MRLQRNFVLLLGQLVFLTKLCRLGNLLSQAIDRPHGLPHPPERPDPDATTTLPEAVDHSASELDPDTSSALSRVTSSSPHTVKKNNSPVDHKLIIQGEAQREIPSTYGNFERVIEPTQLDSPPIQFAKWRSKKTGLTVVWADVEGPLIDGFFTIPTEIFNDSGIPHTLEHLIFLGSKKYPHKDVLSILANRSFASGAGAWTDTTHTVFTLDTASSEGFLRLLPVYFDHLLNPTLTDEAFTTEVYHINGEGEEGGVVFSEMQARENTPYDLMELCRKRHLFPSSSAYRSETAGSMEALRALRVEEIREYHRSYYQPHNIQLVVSGKVDPYHLLEVLDSKVEPTLAEHGQSKQSAGWTRPFLETASKGGPQLAKDQTVQVEFPEKDESIGEVSISWVGPDNEDPLLETALRMLFTFLTDSSASPLSKKLIEIDSPMCTAIMYDISVGEKMVLTIYLSSVPSKHLSTISDSVKKVLAEEVLELDMSRFKMVIERSALQEADHTEVHPSHTLTSKIISNFLYGSDSDLVSDLQSEPQRHKIVAGWTADKWTAILKQWLIDPPSLCVIGKPSSDLNDELEAARIKRVEENRRKYGPDGLTGLAEKLSRAQEINGRAQPDNLIDNFPVPALDSVHWINVDIANSMQSLATPLQSHLDSKDPASLPFFVQFNHIKSNSISIYVTLSPSKLPKRLIPLLAIYVDSFFSLPVKRKDGTRLAYHEVAHQLGQHTVQHDIVLGSPITQTLMICMKVEKNKYNDAISLLRDLLYGSVLDIDRLKITTTKALQDIPTSKRDGDTLCSEIYTQTVFDSQRSPRLATNVLQQESNLPGILQKLESKPDNVISQMEELRRHLLKTSSMRIGVSGDIYFLEEPKSSWLKHFEPVKAEGLEKLTYGDKFLTPEGINPSGKVHLMSMPFMESSYAYFTCRGPQGFDHPDEVPLLVALNFLDAEGGSLWNAIRGPGLAYHAIIGCDFELGHVSLDIQRSPDIYQAYRKAGDVIRDLVDRKVKIDNSMIETTKSSAVYSASGKVANGPDAAFNAFAYAAMKGVSKDTVRERIEKAQFVTVEEVLAMMKKYLLPMFDSKTSFASITCASDKSQEVAQKLRLEGFKVDVEEIENKPPAGSAARGNNFLFGMLLGLRRFLFHFIPKFQWNR